MKNSASIRQYAEHRGVTPGAVYAAIKSGRLRRSIARHSNGRPQIVDIYDADAEWKENTRQSNPEVDLAQAGVPPVHISRARREAAKASMATLDLLERKNQLVPVEKVRAEISERFANVRTRLLAIPTEARDRLPELSDVGVDVLGELIRDALSELTEDIG